MTAKFVVAGTGWVAGEYFKAILDHPEAEVHGVISRDGSHAAARLQELGIDSKVYGSFEEAAGDPEVDAMVLCSTPEVRPEQAILAARNGKHLVIEKPVALDKESLWKMAEAIEEHQVRTVVGFVLRWNPMFDTVRSLIDDDALGRIFMAQADYWHHIGPQYDQYRWSSKKELGRSSTLSAGCHAVDAIRYFAGDVEEVTAYSCGTWPDSDYEFDPNVIAMLRLSNGGIGKVSSSLECKTPYRFNLQLLGEKGTIMDNRLFSHKLPGQTDYATIPTISPDSGDVSHHPFKEEIEDFVRSLQSGEPTRCDFSDAFKTMEVCFAVDESAALGKSVALPLSRG
jgi:UDP-N-acetyl-2-amino-2-deoxyglucuronate dehydrogenase